MHEALAPLCWLREHSRSRLKLHRFATIAQHHTVARDHVQDLRAWVAVTTGTPAWSEFRVETDHVAPRKFDKRRSLDVLPRQAGCAWNLRILLGEDSGAEAGDHYCCERTRSYQLLPVPFQRPVHDRWFAHSLALVRELPAVAKAMAGSLRTNFMAGLPAGALAQ
jgi:hypothetical protein